MSSTAPAPKPGEQALIDAAKASLVAYGEKNWNEVRARLAENVLYDEVGTQRTIRGIDDVIAAWKGWSTALPDSKATIHDAFASGNTVVVECTWRGTHTGTLELPSGPVAATNRSIDVRACQVHEMADGRSQTIRHYFDMVTFLAQLGLMP
jgi:steroid delta-isomerase-like uncharacterized protein